MMIMSGLRISGSDAVSVEMRTALAGGWRRSDLYWERIQETANRELRSGRRRRAAGMFLSAMAIALTCFPRTDPRYAASLANAGFALRVFRLEAAAARFYRDAIEIWSVADRTLEAAEIRPRARSSLFHMRMEARHWQTYSDTRKARLAGFIAEADQALRAIASGHNPTCRLFTRWVGEKPAIFDDSRKILGACLLIASEER
jgi:hypothetical protein